MALRKKNSILEGQNEANITPLADVTTTLIVVFLITMPALAGHGINVNQAEAGSESAVVTPTEMKNETLLTVAINPEGITLNGTLVAVEYLQQELSGKLLDQDDKTVVIVPHDEVLLGQVVEVLDIAKASGAESLAMLNEIGR
jgi:biopolymer transport protein ExbD